MENERNEGWMWTGRRLVGLDGVLLGADAIGKESRRSGEIRWKFSHNNTTKAHRKRSTTPCFGSNGVFVLSTEGFSTAVRVGVGIEQ